jgi:hypothetical protein
MMADKLTIPDLSLVKRVWPSRVDATGPALTPLIIEQSKVTHLALQLRSALGTIERLRRELSWEQERYRRDLDTASASVREAWARLGKALKSNRRRNS